MLAKTQSRDILISAAHKLANDFVLAGISAYDVERKIDNGGVLPLPGAYDSEGDWLIYRQALVREMFRLTGEPLDGRCDACGAEGKITVSRLAGLCKGCEAHLYEHND